jgi:hypothetical protein
MLTTFDLDEYVFGVLKAGANGFLLKDTPPADLLADIRLVAAGDVPFGPPSDVSRAPRPTRTAGSRWTRRRCRFSATSMLLGRLCSNPSGWSCQVMRSCSPQRRWVTGRGIRTTSPMRTESWPMGSGSPNRSRTCGTSMLLAAGVDLRTTAGRLGHGDGGATTLKVYARGTRPADQRAAELLADDLLELPRKAAGGVTRTTASGLIRVARPIGELLTPAPTGCTYMEVAAGVREAVSTGRLEPTDLVPTVTDLAEWFSVARSTAQRAAASAAAVTTVLIQDSKSESL